jgi:histidine triad (HIT) family protein
MRDDCIFCKIIFGELPSYKIYEDDVVLSILDIAPWNRGHVIVILKNHKETIFELTEKEAEKIMPTAKKIAVAVKKAMKCEGINLIQNNGEIAGQTVNHYHLHIIPRYKEDNITIEAVPVKVNDYEEVKDEIVRNLERIK